MSSIEKLTTPLTWNGDSVERGSTSNDVVDGVYTLTTVTECHIVSSSDQQTDAIWLTTPVLNEHTIAKLQDVQLFTVQSLQQQGQPQSGSTADWTWFDLVVLEDPESRTPVVINGRSLVWKSHDVPIDLETNTVSTSEQTGPLFGPSHEIFSRLKPGNVIAVRPSTRFVGRELHAHSAKLVVRLSSKGREKSEIEPSVSWEEVFEDSKKLQDAINDFLASSTRDTDAEGKSIENGLLTRELRSDETYGAGDPPLRILSLDGGGVRGIASLHVIKDIMNKVAGNPNAKPCDYFDMIAGTSTGGLIAIMLGRLRMTVDECIAEYNNLAKDIFGINFIQKGLNFNSTGAFYSGKTLEQAVKKVVGKNSPTRNPDELMRDPLVNGCKVFVLACRADKLNRTATHMRTYVNANMDESFDNYKIWEAARATSAAPAYFPRLKVQGNEFVDGGIGFNNPILLVMSEARLYFGEARPVGVLVTIGTGMIPNIALPDEGHNAASNAIVAITTGKRLAELSTAAEVAHLTAKGLMSKERYYRFNLGIQIAGDNWADLGVELDDYEKMEGFGKMADEYMKKDEEFQKAKKVAVKLPPKRPSA